MYTDIYEGILLEFCDPRFFGLGAKPQHQRNGWWDGVHLEDDREKNKERQRRYMQKKRLDPVFLASEKLRYRKGKAKVKQAICVT